MKYLPILLMVGILSCSTPDLTPLEQVLRSSHPAMLNVLHDPAGYEIQIMYSRIIEDETGKLTFEDYNFRADDEVYFYPASTVKFPAAVMAMEKIDANERLKPDTSYFCGRDSLSHSVEDDVRQIFAVSDNEAYNRLYEWMGRDAMNRRLRELNIAPVRLSHRLSTPDSEAAERSELTFILDNDTLDFQGVSDTEIEILPLKKLKKGKGYMRDETLVNQAMDFSRKNYFPLSTQHELTKRLIFPEMFPENKQFQLSETSRQVLMKAMSSLPRETGYDEEEYKDSYVKFFLYGDSDEPIPAHMKIYNKVGYAYGTLTETAYIVDEEEEIQFILSATIQVNKNGIFNDDTYEYEEIGIPFLAQLGREFYVYERTHRR